VRFDRETSGFKKAKLLGKLGDAQFEEARRAGKARREYDALGPYAREIPDNDSSSCGSLEEATPQRGKAIQWVPATGDARAKGIREVDETILVILPKATQPPLQLVRQDLMGMDDELLKMLFPRRPVEKHEAALRQKRPRLRLPRRNSHENQNATLTIWPSFLLAAPPFLRARAQQQKITSRRWKQTRFATAETVTNGLTFS